MVSRLSAAAILALEPKCVWNSPLHCSEHFGRTKTSATIVLKKVSPRSAEKTFRAVVVQLLVKLTFIY